MEVIINLQEELAYLRSNNERLLKASREQEKMISGINENSCQKIVEPEIVKGEKRSTNQISMKVGRSLIVHIPKLRKKRNKQNYNVNS